MPLRPKQFYVAERHPDTSREEFQRNWRGHSDLAQRQPLWDHIWHYTQGDSLELPAEAAARIPALDAAADGVSTVYFQSMDSVMAIPAAPEHPILLRDEERIFANMVAEVSIFTEEEVLFEDAQPGAKLVLFLAANDPGSQAVFEGTWRAHAEGLGAPGGLRPQAIAYRLNFERPLPAEELPPSSLDAFDGVCEIGFADAEALAECVRGPRFGEMLDELTEFATIGRALATSELLLDHKEI